jgi:hypothetical protein
MGTAIPSQVFELSGIDRALQPQVGQVLPGALAGLQAARLGRLRFHGVMPAHESKEFANFAARAALRGFVLTRLESDAGWEELLATRGAVTLRFGSREAVSAWLAG